MKGIKEKPSLSASGMSIGMKHLRHTKLRREKRKATKQGEATRTVRVAVIIVGDVSATTDMEDVVPLANSDFVITKAAIHHVRTTTEEVIAFSGIEEIVCQRLRLAR